MTNKLLFKDDIGIVIRTWAGAELDLSSATSLKLAVKKPNGNSVEWTASLADDNNYYAVYTTIEDDLDQLGVYQVALRATFASGAVYTGKTDTFEVVNRYDDLCN